METNVNAKSNFGGRGWLLILMCLATNFAGAAPTAGMNIAAGYFSVANGWSMANMMLGVTIGQIAAAVMCFVLGRLMTHNFSPRRLLLILAIAYAFFFIMISFSVSLPMFYIFYAISCVAMMSWSYMCNGTMVANWFPRKRGLAMGWVTMGTPLGSGFAALIMGQVFARTNIHFAFVPYAALGLVVAIIMVICLKDFPSQCGCYPDNDKNFDMEKMKEEEEQIRKTRESSVWKFRRCISTKEFWFIVLAVGFMTYVVGFVAQMTTTLVSFGVQENRASYFMLLVCCIACVGSYFIGVIDVKLGVKRAMYIAFILVFFMVLFVFIPTLATKIIAFIIVGIVMGAVSNFMLSSTMTLWGPRDAMAVFQYSQPFASVIGAFGTYLIAFIAQMFGGNYNMSFLFIGILCVIGLICMIFAKKENVEKKSEKYAEMDAKKAKKEG